jgi:beta-lactamase regulating signal transducer with metallopeptidase domain
VKLDGANRAFLAVLGVSWLLAGYAVCGTAAGVLVPIVVAHIAREGWGALGSVSLVPTFLVLGLVTTGVLRAAGAMRRQLVASRRVARRTRALTIDQPRRLAEAARASGLAGRVAVVADPHAFSLVHGALRPQVVISAPLLELLSDKELRAVLEHERYHVANLDPLKSVAIQVLSAGLFFLPMLEPLQARYSAARELAADRHAISVCGRRSLAGALMKAVHCPDWCEANVAVGLGGETLLSSRVMQLETGAAPSPGTLRLARIGVGLAESIGLLTAGAVVAAGAAGLSHTSTAGLAAGALSDGIVCSAPFACLGLALYLGIAIREWVAGRSRGQLIAR